MSKTLVIYCYFRETEATRYFFKHGVEEIPSVDYMVVINQPNIDEPISLPQEILNYKNVTVLNRDNSGRDWGAYSHALQHLKDSEEINNYDYFVFLNETVIGPFFPLWADNQNWTTAFTSLINERDKLVGCTINCNCMIPDAYMPHVQTFLFATDQTGVKVGFDEGIFSNDISDLKFDVIYEKEIGYSRAILSNNYNISCLMPCYKGVDFRNEEPKKKGGDPWNENAYFSCNIHPFETIFFKNNRKFQGKLINNLISWSNL